MTTVELIRDAVHKSFHSGSQLPEDDEGLTRYVVDGNLDLDQFDYELDVGTNGLLGAFPEDGLFQIAGDRGLSEAEMKALAWLSPVSAKADHLRRNGGYVCDDPTIQSIANSFDRATSVPSGQVWRMDPPEPRTAREAWHAGRQVVLWSFIVSGSFSILAYLTCKPVCQACPTSPVSGFVEGFPFVAALTLAIPLLTLWPGIRLLARNHLSGAEAAS
jgi:hypothetical protein